MATERLRATIHGRVQGVFYRDTTVQQAQRLGLVGWVMNKPDGTVELSAEGPRDALETLLRWCHIGPEEARVEGVDSAFDSPTGADQSFRIR